MSLQKIDPLQLVVYKGEENNIYFNVAFSFFNCLFSDEESGAAAFIKQVNVFSGEDLAALTHEMKLLNEKTLLLNEHKTIILVCVLYYVSYAFLNDAEEAVLTRSAGETPEEMLNLRNKFLHFSTTIINYTKQQFASRERFSNIIRWFEENGI